MKILVTCLISIYLSGCAVVAVADAGITVVATGVKVATQTVGVIADSVFGDDEIQ